MENQAPADGAKNAAETEPQSVDLEGPAFIKKLSETYLFIRTNGLAQSLAFLKNKDSPEARALLGKLEPWLVQKLGTLPGQGDFIEEILQRDSRFLRAATSEALSCLENLWSEVSGD